MYLAIDYKYCSDDRCVDDIDYQFAFFSTHYNPEFWSSFRVGDQFTLLLDSNKNLFWFSLFDLHKKNLTWPVIVKVAIYAGQDKSMEYYGEEDDDFSLYREETEINFMRQEAIKNGEPIFKEKEGCFISMMKWGEGDSVKIGKEVTLTYQAYFSNGEKFDDTEQWNDSMTFSYGQPLQVIDGLEKGIKGLTEGSEAKLIIPSRLAFGEEGSSSGIVPPYEALLYDIKIISVNDKADEISD